MLFESSRSRQRVDLSLSAREEAQQSVHILSKPKKDLTSLTEDGTGHSVTVLILRGSVDIPSPETTCPKKKRLNAASTNISQA